MGRHKTHQAGGLVERAEELAEIACSSPAPADAFTTVALILAKRAGPTAAGAVRHAFDVRMPTPRAGAAPSFGAVREAAGAYGALGEEAAAESEHRRLPSLRGTTIRQRSRQRILDAETLSSSEVSEVLGSESQNPRQYAMELRKRGELLGVKVKNHFLYPAFQFDMPRRCVYDVVKKVGRILGADRDPWGVLSWWLSPNARIPGSRAPKELLADPHRHRVLVELAEAVTEDSG